MFERVGMSLFHGHTVEERNKWFKEVWDKNAMVKGEFSIV